MKKLNKGILISVEGIDGSGKSTLASGLSLMLAKADYPVLLTRQPGGTEFGKKIREVVNYSPEKIDYLTEFLLFSADRAEHIAKVVKPALEEGKIIISDRMADSAMAYQGCGRGIDTSFIKMVSERAMQNVSPDLVLYTWVDVETAFKRISERPDKKTVFEKEKREFFERVAGCYEEIFSGRSDVVKIDAREVEEIVAQQAFEEVIEFVEKFSKPEI